TDTIKLGKKIGSGAQAEIFKAQCGLDDVVVKRFLDSTHERTKQEVDIIKQLTHKHIVQFYHVHHDMIVMEYIEGGNLAEAIIGSGLKSWQVKTQIAKDISLGLAHLHSQGIIHCDIKSSNILLTEHKEAKICDFGLAMRVGETAGGGGGTLQWMAPELLQNPQLYTTKSDVYALGMVMWEMASGSTQPYREHTPDGVMYCILHGILEEYPDNTPKSYAAAIQMCWKQAPEERPYAVDMLPDVGCSSQIDDVQELTEARNYGDKSHFRKALKQYVDLDMLKDVSNLERGDGKAMEWFNINASGNNSAAAMFTIGRLFQYGHGVEQHHDRAMEWYLAASEAGIAVAMLKISQIYQYGQGVRVDENESASWYRKAEERVNEQGKFNNRAVHHEAGVSDHHRRTMDWFSETVGNEAIAAKLSIGNTYYYGGDLEQDYGRAMEWYLKASDAGNASAMFNIGIMYDSGLGIEQDYGKAMEWYLKASDAGNASAMFNIGYMYRNGQGVEQDYGKAIEWYLRASDAGNASAMFNIGYMYRNGQGAEQDYGKAMGWYLKASEAGNATAMGNIGNMYDIALGVKQDNGKAMEWYLKASDAGNATAMCHIGIMYRDGLGVKQDYGKAIE
ncbi:hypothetical protein BGZ68_003018, partial [Mortierella alpina]